MRFFKTHSFIKKGAVLLTVLIMAVSMLGAYASELKLMPGGQTIGIKLFSKGVMVVRLSPIKSGGQLVDPATKAGILVGDVIEQINGQKISTNEQIQSVIEKHGANPMEIVLLRQGKQVKLTATPEKSDEDGLYKLGIFVRDSMAGIGTVTYINPDNNTFGALGHGICDVDTVEIMPLERGEVIPSRVSGIIKGTSGSPGELRGDFDLSRIIGDLQKNTDSGIFGNLFPEHGIAAGEALYIASSSEVETGKAKILSNVNGTEICAFDIEILSVNRDKEQRTRNMMIKVTDKNLLSKTGGIVQGMSGSPIIQNGKLVGAVTHVLVNDPQKGYAIFIENMIKEQMAA